MKNPEKEVENLIQALLGSTLAVDFKNKIFSVGGFVRDEVLGIASHDLDIVIELPNGAEKFSKLFSSLFPQKISQAYQMGAHYPIWHLHFKDDIQFEGKTFLTAQAEVDFADTQVEMFPDAKSRQRISSFGTLEQDIERRDFTVNMLLRDLTTGELKDLTGVSLQDIQKGYLRGHPQIDLNKIFIDDPLRMLRLIRFQARFSWSVATETLECIRQNADRIQIVSAERINIELTKIMEVGKLAEAVKMMDSTGLLVYIFPEVAEMKIVEQDIYHHSEGSVYIHTLLLLQKARPTVVAQLAALLHDVGKKSCQTYVPQSDGAPPRIRFLNHENVGAVMSEKILRRLKFDLDTIKKVKKLIQFHLRAFTSKEWTDKAVRKFIRDCGDDLEDVLHLTEIDGLSSFGPNGQPKENVIPALRERIKKVQLIPINKKAILTGDEVMMLLKIKGPEVKEALNLLQEIEDELAVEGKILTPDQARILLKERHENLKN